MFKRADNPSTRDEARGREHIPTDRAGAIRAGWNDAAWGRKRRTVPDCVTRWYELGYTGGLVFRRQRHSELGDRWR
jgi:hypothetical protein